METILLLALGAFLLSRQNQNGSANNNGQETPLQLPPPQLPPQGLPVELSRIRLPHVIIGGKEVVYTTLPIPATAVFKWVECKQPGGQMRVADIQGKYAQYETAYTNWVGEGRPERARKGSKKGKIIKALIEAKDAYQKTLTAHFSACANYELQLWKTIGYYMALPRFWWCVT